MATNTQNKKEKQTSSNPSWMVQYQPYFKPASIIVLAVVFVIGTAVILFNQSKNNNSQQAQTPQAMATDLPGWWYYDHFGTSVCDKETCKTENDPDSDKLNNGQEFYYKTDPNDPDSNDNDRNDGEDVANGFDPSKPGSVTFQQAESDEEIFGESLLFGEDVKKDLATSLNPNNVIIELVADSELRITNENSVEALTNYLLASEKAVTKYFTKDKAAYIANAMNSNNVQTLNEIKDKAANTILELKRIEVPREFVALHKYTIAYFTLLQRIVFIPDDAALGDEFNPQGNKWFDDTQAFMVLMDRIEIETKRLKQIYNLPT
ncbi:MAG TPA: hypothetical protein VD998_00515 [Verrucomicrobiae bacterium]|nr:hypothetical protein [Verrucomicrobiae bacterium]